MLPKELLHAYKQLRWQITQAFADHPHHTTIWMADAPFESRPRTLLKISRPPYSIYTEPTEEPAYLVHVHIVRADNVITGGYVESGMLMLLPLTTENTSGEDSLAAELELLAQFDYGVLVAVYVITRQFGTMLDVTDDLDQSILRNAQN